MKCVHCGHDLEKAKLFCPNCGKEVQIVPVYNQLEDELVQNILTDDQEGQGTQDEDNIDSKEFNFKAFLLDPTKRKTVISGAIACVLIFVLLIVGLVFITISSKNSRSFYYQFSKGQQQYEAGDYKDAIAYLEKAVKLDRTDLESRVLLLDCYMNISDINSALVLCQEIIRISPDNTKAYATMIQIYESNNEFDKILELSNDVTDANVLELFKQYNVEKPTFSIDGGEYAEFLTLKLEATNNLSIYYTIDGSDPIENGKKYVGPIELNQNYNYVVCAVCRNEKGLYGEVVMNVYSLHVDVPQLPEISPEPDAYKVYTTMTYITMELPEDCRAYYTWDGTEPDTESELTNYYTEPIPIPVGTNVFTLVVVDSISGLKSEIFTGSYTYKP